MAKLNKSTVARYLKGGAGLAVFFVALLIFINYAKGDEVKVPEHVLSLSKQDLLKQSDRMLAEGKTDSAMILYKTLVSYTDPSKEMSHEDASAVTKAYLNLGRMHYKEPRYLSYNKAYSYNLEAVNLAEKYDLQEELSSACLDLGILYQILSSAYDDQSFNDTIISLFEKSLNIAISLNDIKTADSAAKNLASECYANESLEKSQKLDGPLLEEYFRMTSRDGKPLSESTLYTRAYCKTLSAMAKGDNDETLRNINLMNLYSENKPANIINNYSIHGDLMFKLGKNKEALLLLDTAGMAAKQINDVWISLQIENGKSTLYNLLGDHVKSDSCLAVAQALRMQMIKDGSVGQIKDLHFMNQIDNLNFDLQKMMMERTYTRRILIFIGIAASVFAILLVIIFFAYKKLRVSYGRIYDEYTMRLSQKEVPPSPLPAVMAVTDPVEAENVIPVENDMHTSVTGEQTGPEEENGRKYQGRQLSDEESQYILEKVIYVLKNSELIFTNKFQIKDLASLAGEPSRVISQVINDKLGCNFSSILAEYRIHAVCRKISESEDFRKLTIEAMAETVGIQSRSYFSTTFKKVTGLSPSEFIRQANRKAHELRMSKNLNDDVDLTFSPDLQRS